MTPQEAINKVKRVKGLYAYESDYEAFDMAIEALKRDVPVKPIRITFPIRTKVFGSYDWKCPVCNCFLAYEEDGKYLILAHEKSRCSNCFQLIDWSGEDDT